jgi:hypothetical protein
MNIDEAKTKWCPFSRTGNDMLVGMNRQPLRKADHPLPDTCLCLVDACMCWKWEDRKDKDGYGNFRIPTGKCGLSK